VSARATTPAGALPGTYWVEPGRLLAGSYPGHFDPAIARARIAALRGVGVDWFIDLTRPDELPGYESELPSPYAADGEPAVAYSRRPIADHGVPESTLQMAEILDEIEDAIAAGHCVYVHCRAGIGRTGTVVGCYLARRLGGEVALEELNHLWRLAGRHLDWPQVPETEAQAEFVRAWTEAPRAAIGAERAMPVVEVADRLRDRYRGLLLGLALGDALAAPVQHRRPGSFAPVGDLTGGGPYDLARGAWTDDTAIAVLLAASLADSGAFEPRDFMARLFRWQRDGQGSATGQCVGISAATAKAIAQAQWSGNPFAGSHDPARADKEPLVRAGVAAAFALSDPAEAITLAAEVARPTHQSPQTLDGCRYFAALVVGALQGATREELCAPDFTPVPGLWERRPLRREIAAVAAGAWRAPGYVARADGGAADALGLVLAALEGGRQFRDTVLAAINLGQDADVNGALAGQLAGALYGAAALPAHWVAALADGEGLTRGADALLGAALARIARD
jgi:ADP-ribosylglycohydrolase